MLDALRATWSLGLLMSSAIVNPMLASGFGAVPTADSAVPYGWSPVNLALVSTVCTKTVIPWPS